MYISLNPWTNENVFLAKVLQKLIYFLCSSRLGNFVVFTNKKKVLFCISGFNLNSTIVMYWNIIILYSWKWYRIIMNRFRRDKQQKSNVRIFLVFEIWIFFSLLNIFMNLKNLLKSAIRKTQIEIYWILFQMLIFSWAYSFIGRNFLFEKVIILFSILFLRNLKKY